MRTTTGAEDAVLASYSYDIYTKVEVENGSGTYKDLTNLGGYDWLEDGSVRVSVDEPIWQGTFHFRRDREGTLSLAPLREDSTLNVDDGASYSPLLDGGRGIRCSIACVAKGASPSAGDYKTIFDGRIDKVSSHQSPVEVVARGALGRAIVDDWVRADTDYGAESGIAIEDVKQTILDDWEGSITLNTPSSPGFVISPAYTQNPMSIQDAFTQLDALIGWVTREKWDDGSSSFKLTFENPDRDPSTTHWVFGPDDYFSVDDLTLDLDGVRNVIELSYPDISNGRTILSVTDTSSVLRYNGERWMRITLADDSPIDTAAEANDLLAAALWDLKDPLAALTIGARFFWPAELGDYYGFSANAVRWSTQQDLAVVSIDHRFGSAWAETQLQVRGKPCGMYTRWRQISKTSEDVALNKIDTLQLVWEPYVQAIAGGEPVTVTYTQFQALYADLTMPKNNTVASVDIELWSDSYGPTAWSEDIINNNPWQPYPHLPPGRILLALCNQARVDASPSISPPSDEPVYVNVTPYNAIGGGSGGGDAGTTIKAQIEGWGSTGTVGARAANADDPMTVYHSDLMLAGPGVRFTNPNDNESRVTVGLDYTVSTDDPDPSYVPRDGELWFKVSP